MSTYRKGGLRHTFHLANWQVATCCARSRNMQASSLVLCPSPGALRKLAKVLKSIKGYWGFQGANEFIDDSWIKRINERMYRKILKGRIQCWWMDVWREGWDMAERTKDLAQAATLFCLTQITTSNFQGLTSRPGWRGHFSHTHWTLKLSTSKSAWRLDDTANVEDSYPAAAWDKKK